MKKVNRNTFYNRVSDKYNRILEKTLIPEFTDFNGGACRICFDTRMNNIVETPGGHCKALTDEEAAAMIKDLLNAAGYTFTTNKHYQRRPDGTARFYFIITLDNSNFRDAAKFE